MNWQEYQDAVGELYIQMEGIGQVSKNITIPDKITGQARQVDVWLEVETKSHKIGILIDAKYRKDKIDVKDVEEIFSLANAVGANKCVLVALSGWTKPAAIRAQYIGLDLKLFTLEEALDIIVPDKWFICPICEHDCIVIDCAGGMIVNGMWSLLTAGRCRKCHSAKFNCWACGGSELLKLSEQTKCDCGHTWKNSNKSMMVRVNSEKHWNEISSDVILLDPESVNTHIKKGLSLKENGNSPAAIDEFTKAIELMPWSASLYYHRAITHDEYNQKDKAIEDYTICLELNPKYAMGYGSRGIAYYASKRFAEAISDLEYYLTLEPDSPSRIIVENAIIQAKLNIQ